MQNLSVGVVVHGPDRQITLYNKTALTLLGLSGDQMLGKVAPDHAWCFIREDGTPMPIEEYPAMRVITTGEPVHDLVVGIKRPQTNDCAWVVLNGFPEFAPDGQLRQVVNTFADITASKLAGAKLAEQERYLSNVINNIGDPVFVKDEHSRLILANDAFCSFMGLPRSRIVGYTMAEDLPADQMDGFLSIDRQVLGDGRESYIEELVTVPKGETLTLETRKARYTNEAGKKFIVGVTRDITKRKQTEAALQQSAELLEASQSIAKVGGWELDLTSKTLFWTAETYRIHETSPAEFNPTVDAGVNYFLPESRRIITDALQAAIEHGKGYDLELQTHTTKGRLIDVRTTCEVTMMDGRPVKLTGIFQDITERKQAEEVLISVNKTAEESRERLLLATDSGQLGVWDYDLTTGSLLWDPWMYRLYGVEPTEATGTYELWSSHLHPDDKPKAEAALNDVIADVRPFDTEFRIVWRDGTVHHLRAKARVSRDEQGKAVRVTGVNWDITESKEHEHQLEHIAHYDALTQLPNRVLLADRLQQAMAQCQRRGQMLAVAYLDLDGFKAINDSHGHNIGDQVLVELAQRMKAALREGDTLSRLGGDEFVAILGDLDQPQDCQPVLQRLLEAAASPIATEAATLKVSASMGVTVFPLDDVGADQLLRHADKAMYTAKEEGKNRYRMFDVEQDSAAKKHRMGLESIRRAIDHDEFVLYYQPKVNVRTGAVVGTEALIRWQHPQRGLLAPGLFLPLMEGQAISVEVGEWVIRTALQQISSWRAAGLEMPVSVNVGALQLQGSEFVAKLSTALAARPDLPRGLLEIEIVETSALEDVAQVSNLMHDCIALGVGFALDDFGTGYSSLTYLKRLPVGLLKIDQGFVRDMLTDADDLAIVQGVIGLARVFKREVIAEGVETEAHATQLLALGCELAQGYGIARPMPAAELPAWVQRWHARAIWTA